MSGIHTKSELELLRTFAREEFGIYSVVQFPQYEKPPHLLKVISALERVERGECKRLIICMPPRCGKSLTVSQLFPAWYLGRHPERYIISTAYGEDLALDFGRQVRNFIMSPQHKEIFPGSPMSEDSQSAHRFRLDAGGAYYAVGRGGPITGRGAHLLLIDDPLKDKVEAQSETVRKQLQEWYQTVAYTRLMPGGAVVIATTRWHVDDLPGWLLSEHADQNWEILSFEAINESEDDPLGREVGEPLWPDRFPIDVLKDTRRQIGSQNWEALYQQKPVLDGGYTFRREWFNTWDAPPEISRLNRYVVCDPANSKKKDSDFTAMFVIGLGADYNYYILDLIYDRLNLTERADALFSIHRAWRPRKVGYEEYGLSSDVQHMQERMTTENYRFGITSLKGPVSKIERIKRLVPLFEAGRVWFPPELIKRNKLGVEEDLTRTFLNLEFVKFPAAEHDDMLDALARIVDPEFPTIWPREDDVFQPLDLQKARMRRYNMNKKLAVRGTWMSA